MKERKLAFPKGYNKTSQKIVAGFAAQLDDQLVRLKGAIEGFTPRQLEWQPKSGMNSTGMLLAHLAVVEVFWIVVAAKEIPLQPDGDRVIKKTIGILMDDDGMPLKKGGKHPKSLKRFTLPKYIKMLDKARTAVHKELRKWKDKDLSKTYMRRDFRITKEWTVYHVLEHFAGHYGQILLLKHQMVDARVLKAKK